MNFTGVSTTVVKPINLSLLRWQGIPNAKVLKVTALPKVMGFSTGTQVWSKGKINRMGYVIQAQGQILGRGVHFPWDDFAPLLTFSAPPLRTFASPLIILYNKINLKRQLYKLDKKV